MAKCVQQGQLHRQPVHTSSMSKSGAPTGRSRYACSHKVSFHAAISRMHACIVVGVKEGRLLSSCGPSQLLLDPHQTCGGLHRWEDHTPTMIVACQVRTTGSTTWQPNDMATTAQPKEQALGNAIIAWVCLSVGVGVAVLQ